MSVIKIICRDSGAEAQWPRKAAPPRESVRLESHADKSEIVEVRQRRKWKEVPLASLIKEVRIIDKSSSGLDMFGAGDVTID